MKKLMEHNVGETVDLYVMIKQAITGVTTQGSPFMTVILQDKSGDIEAKLWDTKEEQVTTYRPGVIVKVTGEVHDYRGKNQLRIKKIRLAENEGVTISDLVPSASRSKEELKEELYQYIFDMRNPVIQRIVRHILHKHEEAFLIYPAAMRNHHDYASGLVDHVVSMLRLGKSLVQLYPSLNSDLLYAGIILHDVGKVTELTGPIGTQYTVEGNLIGHISIMVTEIAQAAEALEVEGEEVMLLQHLVLSHHGKEEWGSPKKPMLKEAEMLHYIDNIDAKMMMLDRVMSRTEPGQFTERIFPLDNRSFYKPLLEQ